MNEAVETDQRGRGRSAGVHLHSRGGDEVALHRCRPHNTRCAQPPQPGRRRQIIIHTDCGDRAACGVHLLDRGKVVKIGPIVQTEQLNRQALAQRIEIPGVELEGIQRDLACRIRRNGKSCDTGIIGIDRERLSATLQIHQARQGFAIDLYLGKAGPRRGLHGANGLIFRKGERVRLRSRGTAAHHDGTCDEKR